jgi:hypothetical protein
MVMVRDFEQYKQRHLDFWNLATVKRPLIGFTIGAGLDSWSYWQYNKAALALMNRIKINPQDIDPADFVEDQRKYLELSEQIEDDICRTAIPLASVPWMEAILGCPVFSTKTNMKSQEILENAAALETADFNPANPWMQKYLQFVQVYKTAFEKDYPVAQSILRGPSDLACALLGPEKATLALVMESEAMKNLLTWVTDRLEAFLRWQLNFLPSFHDGYVIGQYEIWTPQPAIRIQEDYSVLYSPQLYREFLRPLDEQLAAIVPYTLIHLHSSSLFLIEEFLSISAIRAFQITKDIGQISLTEMLPALQKIQRTGQPLILKGQFNPSDLQLIKSNLSVVGLCLQPVVKDIREAKKMLPILLAW